MKTIDFESAIEGLACSIVCDEVKLQKGHVHRFYGHNGHTLIMWDAAGRGYSMQLGCIPDEGVTHDTHDVLADDCYKRDPVYDLTFE